MGKFFVEFLPVAFLSYVLFIIILIEKLNKIIKKDIIKNLKRKELDIKFPTKYTIFEKIIFHIMFGSSIMIFSFFIMAIITESNYDFFSNLLFSVENLNNICIGITTIAITVSIVVITFSKDYYLVFSIKDVLRTQYFALGVVLIIITCLCSQMFVVIILGIRTIDNLFGIFIIVIEEIVLIINYGSSIYVMFIVFRILLSEEYFELTILKQLYRKMWNSETILFNIKDEWNKCATDINIAFLIQDYRKRAKDINIEKMERFYFATLSDVGGIRWYKKAILKLLMICTVLGAFSGVICLINGELYILMINIAIVIFVIIIFTTKKFMNKYYMYLNKIVYDSWGYYIKSMDKEYFCGIISLFPPKKIEKYIHSIKNIICFSRIGKEVNFQDDKEVVIEYILKRIVRALENGNYKNGYIKSMYQLPVFLIGYFQYQTSIENNCMKICKQIYEELNLEDFEKSKLNETLYGFTLDINREICDEPPHNRQYCDYWNYLNNVK